jgi:hypothetical protein
MNFTDQLLPILKQIASINIARCDISINADCVFQLDLIAFSDEQMATIATITENATEPEILRFKRELNILKSAATAQDEEDAEIEAKIIAALNKLTRDERILINLPLPEDVQEDDQEFCGY